MTTEILKTEMQQLGCSQISLKQGNWTLGMVKINKAGNLEYYHRYALRYYPDNDIAFAHALRTLRTSADMIREFNENTTTIFSTTMRYEDFDDPQYNRSHDIPSRYDSDFKDSGVTADGCTFSGTLNQLRLFLTYTNNHHRYCRCKHEYENEHLNDLLKVGYDFGLFTNRDSFGEYYHNAIVD